MLKKEVRFFEYDFVLFSPFILSSFLVEGIPYATLPENSSL